MESDLGNVGVQREVVSEAIDPTEQEQARDGIYARIAELTPIAQGDDLVKLADAYAKVAWGPYGGARATEEDVDYHYTQHPSDEPRRSPGFDR